MNATTTTTTTTGWDRKYTIVAAEDKELAAACGLYHEGITAIGGWKDLSPPPLLLLPLPLP